MKIIDISRKFFSCDVYPGDPKPKAERLACIGEGGDCNITAVHASAHTGTHADAPLHFLSGGAAIDSVELDAFIGPCTVLQVPGGVITGEYVDKHFPKKCKRLLIKGGGRAFFMDSSAEELSGRGLMLIGTDSLSVGCAGNETAPHKAFMQGGTAILEGLTSLKCSRANIFSLPLPCSMTGWRPRPCGRYLSRTTSSGPATIDNRGVK